MSREGILPGKGLPLAASPALARLRPYKEEERETDTTFARYSEGRIERAMKFLRTSEMLLLVFCLSTGFATMMTSESFAQPEGDPAVRFDQALRLGRFDEARQMGQILVDEDPDSPENLRIRYWLGCLQPDYRQATRELEAVARKTENEQLAVLARRRISEMAKLHSRSRDAARALETVLKKLRNQEPSPDEILDEVRLDLAQVYLSYGKERDAEKQLEAIASPDRLSRPQREQYEFCQALALWQDGKRKAFWKKQLAFDEDYPRSDYSAAFLWIAAEEALQKKSNLTQTEKEILEDIVDFYPDSPEAHLARKHLSE